MKEKEKLLSKLQIKLIKIKKKQKKKLLNGLQKRKLPEKELPKKMRLQELLLKLNLIEFRLSMRQIKREEMKQLLPKNLLFKLPKKLLKNPTKFLRQKERIKKLDKQQILKQKWQREETNSRPSMSTYGCQEVQKSA